MATSRSNDTGQPESSPNTISDHMETHYPRLQSVQEDLGYIGMLAYGIELWKVLLDKRYDVPQIPDGLWEESLQRGTVKAQQDMREYFSDVNRSYEEDTALILAVTEQLISLCARLKTSLERLMMGQMSMREFYEKLNFWLPSDDED